MAKRKTRASRAKRAPVQSLAQAAVDAHVAVPAIRVPGRVCFIDTGYFAALVNHADQHHARALELGAELAASAATFVTTHAILLEVGSLLARTALRPYALRVLDGLKSDNTVAILPIDAPLYQRGLALFRARTDKDWSLTDCLSFVVMADHALTEALAYDEHFEQAGFRALMRTRIDTR